MSIFEAYDVEFSSLRQLINKDIEELRDNSSDKDKSNSLIKLIDGLLLQSNDLIKQMELEARSSDQSSRKVLNDKVVQYKKTMQAMKTDFQQLKIQCEKTALIGVSKSAEQRQRLLDTNDK